MKTIEISQLAQTAKDTAEHIGSLIADKRVDPDNLVVMVGEIHEEITHSFFEASFTRYLHQTTGLGTVFTEYCKLDQPKYEQIAKRHPYHKTLHAMFVEDSFHACAGAPYMHYAQRHGIHTQATDLHYYYDLKDRELYTQVVLPDTFPDKYKNCDLITAMCKQNKKLFTQKDPTDVTMFLGAMRRNLFMVDTILDTLQPQQMGVAMAVNGSSHVLHYEEPHEITMSELLNANKKDVINITLMCSDDESIDGYAEARDFQNERVEAVNAENYFENIGLNIQVGGTFNLDGLIDMYRANKQRPPLNLQAINAVRKCFKTPDSVGIV